MLTRRQFLAAGAVALPALAAEKRPRHVLLRSSWQTVNIGDIAHTPGMLALLEKHLGDARVTLWPNRLSAEVAILIDADLLIILTSVDGLQDAKGNVVPVVRDFDEVASLVRSDKGHTSTGGMVTKLQAAQLAVKAGIPVSIASGRKAGLVYQLVAGQRTGTHFPAK